MADEHEGSGLASSLTDLMTSLAVIFILLLVATLNNARQEVQGAKAEVLSRLQDALLRFQEKGVEVKTDPKDPLGLLVVVPEDLLNFPVGRSEIRDLGVNFLKQFMPQLVGTACEPELRGGISSIIVEGHASSEWNEKDPKVRAERNLKLSQERSMAVVQQSLDALNDPGLHDCFLDFVSATGRGSADPLATPEKSRRVIFKVRVKSLEQRHVIAGISPEAAEQENGN